MVTYLGSLVQLCCGREEHCKQMSLACVGRTCSVPATLVLPPLPTRVLSLSTLLRLQAALQGAGSKLLHFPGLSRSGSGSQVHHKGAHSAGPAFCAFPSLRSSGSQELDERTLPGCRAPSPLHGPTLSFQASRLGVPCVCSVELMFNHDPPSRCQPSRISGSLWLETGSLFVVW